MGINGSYADSLTLNSGASLIIETSGYRDMGIAYIGSLRIQDGSELTIHTTGNQGHALNDINTISVEGGSVLNITTEGESSYGTSLAAESSLNIHDSSVVNVKTFKSGSHGFYGGINNIFDKAQINIKTAGSSAEGINKSTINTYGQAILNVFTSGSVSDCIVSGTVNVRGNSVLNLNSSTAENAAAFCYDTINLYDRGIINAYGSAGAMYASTNMPLQLNIFSSLAVFNNYNKDLFFGNSNSLTAVAGAVINQSNGSYVSSSAVQSSGNSLPQEFVKKGDAVFDPFAEH